MEPISEAERLRRYRANITPEERDEIRLRDRINRATSRGNLSDERKAEIAEQERQYRQHFFAGLDEEAKDARRLVCRSVIDDILDEK